MDKIRVALVFGGRSAEHDVSRVSAVSVLQALDAERFEVIPVGITREGRWMLGSRAQVVIGAAGELARGLSLAGGAPVALSADPAVGGLVPVTSGSEVSPATAITAVDVVFPLLHGPFGEDGTVQGLCELAGVPYVGAGVAASAVSMDKARSKLTLRGAGIPVADWIEVREARWERDAHGVREQTAAQLGFPCFVKPANLGSSVGVVKVHRPEELDAAVDHALTYDPVVLVEQAIVGRELEVAVLGDDDPEATLPGEVVPAHEFYDFEDKYVDDGAKLMIPAAVDESTGEACRKLALSAYAALGIEGMARVDLFLTEDGALLVNEANTIPGFTPISMYPKLWEASGLSYSALCARLVDLALERHRRRARLGRPRRA